MDEKLKLTLALGRGFFLKKQYARAERYLTAVVEQSQSFADVYNMLGLIFHDQGQFVKAQRAFEAALRINPRYTEAALNLAVSYNEMGKYREAKEVYQAALANSRTTGPDALDPLVAGKIANLHAEIGDAYAAAGRSDEAVAEYQRALALCPTFVDIRIQLATTLRERGDGEGAIRELRDTVAQNDSNLAARNALGLALYSTGEVAQARGAWEEVLRRSPGNRTAELYLRLVRES